MQGKKFISIIAITVALSFLLGGCGAFGPVRSATTIDNNSYFIAPTRVATPTVNPALLPTTTLNAQPADCTNQLTYEQDLTIPDGTYMEPGSTLDKQWQVKNDGTCNWNDSYSIQLINGDALGAATPQAMVPARSGTEAVIRIVFTAPLEAGKYTSSWQAYDPNGQPFGDYFSIVVNVISK
jgi:hypothetical protein